MLNGMSKEQLLNFIAQKGNDRKTAVYNAAKFQTEDCQKTTMVMQNVQNELTRTMTEQRAWQESFALQKQEAAAEHQKIIDL